MGKRRRTRRVGDKDEKSAEDADPDPQSYEFYHDAIDAFHDRREKILIQKGPLDLEPAESSSEEEVLGLGLDDTDDSEDDEKISGYKKKIRQLKQTAQKFKIRDRIADEESDDEGWGSKKSHYYGADIDDDDDLEVEEADEDEKQGGRALEEEKEALTLQRKLAEQLDDQDFGLGALVGTIPPDDDDDKKEEVIQTDLTKLSRSERIKLFRKESPEFFQLRDDFIVKMGVVCNVLKPVLSLVEAGELGKGTASQYVETRLHLYLNYCVNICFYMLLKSKQIPIHSHPVVKRILQYRNLIKQLESIDSRIDLELADILKRKAAGEPLGYLLQTTDNTTPRRSKAKKKQAEKGDASVKMTPRPAGQAPDTDADKVLAAEPQRRTTHIETSGEREASYYYRMAHGLAGSEDDSDDISEADPETAQSHDDLSVAMETEDAQEGDAQEGDGKRSINYQIEKNKGLTAKRKKAQRNPRVKHRMKYKKAMVKRRSAVREARLPLQPYGGELSGIRAGLKHGIKLQ